jgi:hypothetical protein
MTSYYEKSIIFGLVNTEANGAVLSKTFINCENPN